MITIGICDDEPMQMEQLRNICENCFLKLGIEYELVEFHTGEEIEKYHGKTLTLLFLDIELGETNGIQVMQQLIHSDKVWRIVFVSNHEEAVWNSFGLKTLAFERKPVCAERIEQYIQLAIMQYRENITIRFHLNDPATYVKLEELLYLKGEANYVKVVTLRDQFVISGNLKYWENELKDTPMLRIHKSYLVNMQHIRKLDQETWLQPDLLKLPVGRAYKKASKERYQQYVIEQSQVRL